MEKLLNFQDYSPTVIVLNLICASLWAASYILIVIRIHKLKFIEMPLFAALGNIAWEFLWSTVFHGNMGPLIEWAVKLWLILDIYIIWNLYKYGRQQVFIPEMQKHFKVLFAATFIAWIAALFGFTHIGIDNPIGGRSAIILNLIISALYIFLLFKTHRPDLMTLRVAWWKGIGTACYTISVFLNYGPQDIFIEAVGIIIFILDIIYIKLLYEYRSGKLKLSPKQNPMEVYSNS